jgi:hypothetical protein
MTNPDGQRSKRPSGPRPRPVTIAIWLNVVGLVAAFITAVVQAFSVAQPTGPHQVSPWLVLALFLVVFALVGALLGALAFGRRWAWWVWLVVSVLSLPTEWSGLRSAFEQGGFSATRFTLSAALAITAQVLLLLRSSRQWYGVGRKAGEPRPSVESDEYDYPNWP